MFLPTQLFWSPGQKEHIYPNQDRPIGRWADQSQVEKLFLCREKLDENFGYAGHLRVQRGEILRQRPEVAVSDENLGFGAAQVVVDDQLEAFFEIVLVQRTNKFQAQSEQLTVERSFHSLILFSAKNIIFKSCFLLNVLTTDEVFFLLTFCRTLLKRSS